MPYKPQTHRADQRLQLRREARRQYDRQHQEDRSFYWSAPWRKYRQYFLSQPENALCQLCEQSGRVTLAVDLDHIIPRRDRPDLAFDDQNIRPLCKTCHSRSGSKAQEGR